ncbi:hypothetical protein VNI00_007258 [Paramarasmius palmivorus]|uniref:Uncharacterized protein n=1 Tax=Paramarasmius palmivorus TaxID=297713 RepID=A0AAW0D2I9_9AGAR
MTPEQSTTPPTTRTHGFLLNTERTPPLPYIPLPTVARVDKIFEKVDDLSDELWEMAKELEDAKQLLVCKEKEIESLRSALKASKIREEELMGSKKKEQRVKREKVTRFVHGLDGDLWVLEKILRMVKEAEEV